MTMGEQAPPVDLASIRVAPSCGSNGDALLTLEGSHLEGKLREAFVEALGIDGDATDWDSLAYRGIPEWDSVAHMQLVGEIEDTFDIMLETDDVIDISSFNKAKEILGKYGVASG